MSRPKHDVKLFSFLMIRPKHDVKLFDFYVVQQWMILANVGSIPTMEAIVNHTTLNYAW